MFGMLQVKAVVAEAGSGKIEYMIVSLDDIRAFPYFELVQNIRTRPVGAAMHRYAPTMWLGNTTLIHARLMSVYMR